MDRRLRPSTGRRRTFAHHSLARLYLYGQGRFAFMVHTTSPNLTGLYSRSQFEARHRYLDIVTCGFVALSPLALGGTHPIAAVVLCAAFLLSCSGSVFLHWRAGLSPRHYWPLYAIVALSLWVVIRSTSLGGFTNPPLADAAWALWPELKSRGGIAPGRAALWSVRTLTFAMAAWYAAQRFSRSDRVAWPVVSVIGGGVLVAFVGVLQVLTRTQEHLWFYSPLDWTRVVPLAGPFVNPNQAGAYVGLAAITAFIAARQSPALNRRIIFLALSLPLAGYVMLVDARGAALALLAAGVALLFCAIVEDAPPKRRQSVQIALPLILVTAAAFLLYGLTASRELFVDATLINKVAIWRRALTVPFEAPLFGFGPRGFQDAYAAMGLNQTHVWIEDPESGVLQIFAEHGIPIALLICGGVVWLFVRTHRLARGRGLAIATALSALFTYLLIETITGMGLHASSYLIAAGMGFGVMSGRAIRKPRPEPTPRNLVPAAALCAVALIALAASPHSVRVSLEDSRVPLWNELNQVAIADPVLMERGLELAQQTPGRAALIQQMALVFSAQSKHDRAMELASGLRNIAPNYPSPQRASIHVALKADDLETACLWLKDYADRFGTLPAAEAVAWTEQADPAERCFDTPELQLLASDAYIAAGRTELGYSILFQLATAPDASTDTLIGAIRATLRMKEPLLGALWVDTLLTRDDLTATQYNELLSWARQSTDRPTQVHRIAEAAGAAYPKNAEFRIVYVENFLANLPEDGDDSWYNQIKPVIDSSRVLARGDRAQSQRIILLSADAAWRASRFEEAEKLYRRLPIDDLPKNDAVIALFRLGELSRKREDLYQAKRYYRDALEKNPRFAPAATALAEIGG